MTPRNPRATPWDSGCIKNRSEIYPRKSGFTSKPVLYWVCRRWVYEIWRPVPWSRHSARQPAPGPLCWAVRRTRTSPSIHFIGRFLYVSSVGRWGILGAGLVVHFGSRFCVVCPHDPRALPWARLGLPLQGVREGGGVLAEPFRFELLPRRG